MKKFSNLFNGIKAMTFAAFVGMSTVFGLSSCQDDYFEDQSYIPANEAQEMNIENEIDTVFVYNNNFNYDNNGISSSDQYVSPVGYNNGSKVQSRAGADDFVSQLLMFASSKVSECTGNPIAYAAEFTLNMLLDEGDNPVMTKLEELNNNVDSLTRLTNKLASFVQDSKNSDIYRTHRSKVSILQTMNCTYFNSYNKYLKEGNKEAAKTVLKEWAGQDAGDFKAPYAVLDFLESTILPYSTDGKYITDVFDYWVFNTTPWEHEGYDKRDALRCGDMVVGFTGYMLARAYFEQEGLVNHNGTIKNLDNDFKEFLSFYKERSKVERHYDRLVCQIQGANIVFKKDIKIRDVKSHPWQPNDTENWGLERLMYGDVNMTSQNVLDRSINQNEAEAIFNYYNPKNKDGKYKNGTVKTFEKIMEDVGFDLSGLDASKKKHIMTLSDGCWMEKECWYNWHNWDIYYMHVVVANEDNPIRKNWKLGCMWIVNEKTHKCSDNKKILKWWHNYSNDDCQYFYTNIERRYKDMKAF